MHTNSFAKNKPVKSTDRKADLSDATSKEVQAKIVTKVRVLKL